MNVPETLRILIADDHPVVREGLSAMINRQPGMKVVAEAGDGREAVEQFSQYRPDVALIDLRMRGMDGLQAILAICRRFPGARLVVLTTFDDNADIYRALQGGAKGYFLKGSAPRGTAGVHPHRLRRPIPYRAGCSGEISGASQQTRVDCREIEVLGHISSMVQPLALLETWQRIAEDDEPAADRFIDLLIHHF